MKLEKGLKHQETAVNSIVRVLKNVEIYKSNSLTANPKIDLSSLNILHNINMVQDSNNINPEYKKNNGIKSTYLNLDIKMETLLSNFGTLGDLIGSADGILGIIGDVSIEDLLGDDPAGAIMDALKSSDQTLGSMLGSAQSDNELINSIINIKVGDLFGDVDLSTIIENALTANGNTLGDLLGITDETGLMSYIKNVSMADLLGDNAGDAILNARPFREKP